MLELFYEGGPLFMGALSLIFLLVISIAVIYSKQVLSGTKVDRDNLSLIKSLGLFAMVFGILGQLIGLFDGFKAIEEMGSVSPAILAGGLKVSMITTLYGIFIFIISYLIWLVLNWKNLKIA